MIIETPTTLYTVRVNGITIYANAPSRQIAEAAVAGLPADQRALAEIIPTTADGKQVLFG